MKPFRLRVVSPDQVVFDADVVSARFMGLDGSYGILANHAPLMTGVRSGALRYRGTDDQVREIMLSEGFAEIADNVVTIAAEASEHASEIDVERARAAEKRARDLLANRASLAQEDVLKAEEALRRSMMRQLIGQRAGGSLDI